MRPQKKVNQSSRTAAEIHRFQVWLAERRTSTAPVTTWPPDELDYFGGQAQATTGPKTKRRSR